MKNGLIVRVWIHSIFPIRLYKHKYGIRCLDLSARRCKLAIVDENSTILVYDLEVRIQCIYAFSLVYCVSVLNVLQSG